MTTESEQQNPVVVFKCESCGDVFPAQEDEPPCPSCGGERVHVAHEPLL